MNGTRMSKGFLAALLAVAGGLLIAGCSSAGQDMPTGESEVAEGVRGELLARVQVSASHRVDFYDFGNGAVGAHEVVDIGDEVLLDKIQVKPTLADIYAIVKPGAAVPPALLEAQTRADGYNRRFSKPAQAFDKELTSGSFERTQKPAADAVASHSEALACSGDVLGDNWGAQWFLNNFCNEGCLRSCPTNVASSNWNTTKDWFKWKVMAADFNVKAHTQGSHECGICASAELVWSHDVQPRQIDIKTMTSGYHWYASASSACRIHTAALRCD